MVRGDLLPGAKSVRITISQVFQVTDLITSPERLRKDARKLHGLMAKQRRARNRGQSFTIANLGELRPVGGEDEQNQGFWRTAIATSFGKLAPTVQFVPFELSLTERFNKGELSLQSVLNQSVSLIQSVPLIHSVASAESQIVNKQVSGRMRIYPPGVGVTRITIALTFADAVQVQSLARIAHDIEQVVVVDPSSGTGQRIEQLLLDAIQDVSRFLFAEEYLERDLRWRPPETVYSFGRYEGATIQNDVATMAFLLSRTADNDESEESLAKRLGTALQSKRWTADGILALVSQRASLFLILAAESAGQENKRKRLLEWLSETHELVCAAVYSAQAFSGEISKMADQRLLNDGWLPSAGQNFADMESLFQNMLIILRAIDTSQRDIRSLDPVLVPVANEVWQLHNGMDAPKLQKDLQYFVEWLSTSEEKRMLDLAACVRNIAKLAPLFRSD